MAPEEARRATAVVLAGGAPEAAAYLVRCATGEEQPDKLRIQAAAAVLDRSGFAALHYDPARQDAVIRKPKVDIPDDLSSLSVEELVALEEAIASRG